MGGEGDAACERMGWAWAGGVSEIASFPCAQETASGVFVHLSHPSPVDSLVSPLASQAEAHGTWKLVSVERVGVYWDQPLDSQAGEAGQLSHRIVL